MKKLWERYWGAFSGDDLDFVFGLVLFIVLSILVVAAILYFVIVAGLIVTFIVLAFQSIN